ncbi:hypothetical protein AVEN_161869-1 [Araneus ventricosus]|uniref:Uncharacterized protein n=1 Tax=Araneus ventricosus TaxID=182803 RepID=A0A4Y2LLF6_ARAVE|nr:hypothetical protein AVEN_161869-1 [Araneus ventricosus]
MPPLTLNDSHCSSSSTEAGALVAYHQATARPLPKVVRTLTGGSSEIEYNLFSKGQRKGKAADLHCKSASFLQICHEKVCKCETSLQQVNASLEVTIGRTCSKLASSLHCKL